MSSERYDEHIKLKKLERERYDEHIKLKKLEGENYKKYKENFIKATETISPRIATISEGSENINFNRDNINLFLNEEFKKRAHIYYNYCNLNETLTKYEYNGIQFGIIKKKQEKDYTLIKIVSIKFNDGIAKNAHVFGYMVQLVLDQFGGMH